MNIFGILIQKVYEQPFQLLITTILLLLIHLETNQQYQVNNRYLVRYFTIISTYPQSIYLFWSVRAFTISVDIMSPTQFCQSPKLCVPVEYKSKHLYQYLRNVSLHAI